MSQCVSRRSKRTSRQPPSSTARKRSSERFVFWELHLGVVEAKQISILGDHLARQLHRGLLPAPDPKQYAEQLRATERLWSLGEQPLAWPELRGELLDGVPALTHKVILLSERPGTSLSRIRLASSPSARAESSQMRFALTDGLALSLMASRAASTHSRGMPGSGTGTAIHSERGFSVTLLWRRYRRSPSGPLSATWRLSWRRRLNHHTP